MPRRGAVALLLTTAALALLLSFKTPSEVPTAAGQVAIAGGPSPSPAASGTPSLGGAPGGGADEAAAPTPAPQPGGAAPSTASPGAAATPSPAAATGYRDGTVEGAAVPTRFGTVQVQVTIADGAIVDVQALQLPSGDRHSSSISQRVAPALRSAALAAQSASIDVLSGATYTSLAYAQSLQAALDTARA